MLIPTPCPRYQLHQKRLTNNMPSPLTNISQPRFWIRQNGVYQQVSRLPPSAQRKPPNSLHGFLPVEAMHRGPLSRVRRPLEFPQGGNLSVPTPLHLSRTEIVN